LIGTSDHPLLTAAVFETFLGPKAVDRGARRDIAAGMLWAANGISFDLSSKGAQSVARVNQEGRPELGDGVQVETLPASTSIFSLFAGNEAPPRMLLNRISLQSA